MHTLALFVIAAATRWGVGAVVTGQTTCNTYMCITGLHDSDTNLDTYTLGPPRGASLPRANFGWMAIGFGSQMGGSPMIIAWPGSDGNIILSQRQANNHNAPQAVSSPARAASLLTAQSYTNTSSSSISFTLPSNSDSTSNSTSLIWAYGEDQPGSSTTAQLRQHSGRGVVTLALMTPLQAPTTGSTASASPSGSGTAAGVPTASTVAVVSDSSSGSGSSSTRVIVVHAILGALAAMLFVPLGILSARLGRGWTTSRAWFAVHGVSNLLAVVLAIAAFGFATASFGRGYNSVHRGLGLTFFILIIVQAVLGAAVHWVKPKSKGRTASGRGPTNYVHVVLGLAVTALGFAAVYTGMTREWRTYSGAGTISAGWVAGWAVIVGVVSVAYLAGLALLPRQRRNEGAERASMETSSPASVSQQRIDQEKRG